MDFGARPAAKRGEWERMQMPRYICICTSVRGRKPKGKQRSQRTKKKKEKHAFKITLLLSRWGAGQDAISRASERSADMFPEPLKY